uniref:Uncharacterized protein n=1 Tax=Opuntia streptacantha TaxID=393608 RepID=A0A7C8YYC7_OPUST
MCAWLELNQSTNEINPNPFSLSFPLSSSASSVPLCFYLPLQLIFQSSIGQSRIQISSSSSFSIFLSELLVSVSAIERDPNAKSISAHEGWSNWWIYENAVPADYDKDKQKPS